MTTYLPLDAIEITNQCVVLCDLRIWTGPGSSAWQVFRGSQDEVGRSIAAILNEAGIKRIDDFGGVCKTFLCDGDMYKESPPQTKGNAAVFSFTPKNRITIEGIEMARVSNIAKYLILVLTTQKQDKFGKVWVLTGMLRYLTGENLLYYEDTDSVIDELKSYPDSARVTAVHVQVPGYEDNIAQFADRVISQDEYMQEVLK
jgi:hypothetical protein